MDGNDLRRPGDSFSSLVDRLVVDSGGEIYPDVEPVVEGAQEYGGGGPVFIVVGLVNGAVDMLRPFIR